MTITQARSRTLIYTCTHTQTLSYRMGDCMDETRRTIADLPSIDTSAASPHPADMAENATAHASHPPGPSLVQPDTCGVPAGGGDEEKIAERPQIQLRRPQIAKEEWDLKAQQEVEGKAELAEKADDDQVGMESKEDLLKNDPKEAQAADVEGKTVLERMAGGQMKDQAKKAVMENALQEKDDTNMTELGGYEKVVLEKAGDSKENGSVDKERWEQPQKAEMEESTVQVKKETEDNDNMHGQDHAKIEVNVTAEKAVENVVKTATAADTNFTRQVSTGSFRIESASAEHVPSQTENKFNIKSHGYDSKRHQGDSEIKVGEPQMHTHSHQHSYKCT